MRTSLFANLMRANEAMTVNCENVVRDFLEEACESKFKTPVHHNCNICDKQARSLRPYNIIDGSR